MPKIHTYRLAVRGRREPAGYNIITTAAPDLSESHCTKHDNPIRQGLDGAPPDPLIFRKYMAARNATGYIPTLLRDWVTAHPKYHGEALEQVKAWIEENRHLFKQRSPDA